MMMVWYSRKVLTIGDIKEDVVRQEHFGGNFEDEDENEPERKKTKAEVMQEVIAKSKMYKHERQQQHEEDLEEIEALDAELGELRGLLRSIEQAPQKPQKTQEMLSYDGALREMVYDKRSKPTERTKTEEEIAQEEMERLQKLERERLKRMRGEVADDAPPLAHKPRREGDDLEDDFIPDEEDDYYGLGKGAHDEPSGDESIQNDEEDVDADEGSDDDLAVYFTDEELEEEAPEESEADIMPPTKRLRLAELPSSTKELAYTFPCPSTFEEMLEILKEVPVTSIPTVIERIEILHSTKLRAENREKLEVLYRILRLI